MMFRFAYLIDLIIQNVSSQPDLFIPDQSERNEKGVPPDSRQGEDV